MAVYSTSNASEILNIGLSEYLLAWVTNIIAVFAISSIVAPPSYRDLSISPIAHERCERIDHMEEQIVRFVGAMDIYWRYFQGM